MNISSIVDHALANTTPFDNTPPAVTTDGDDIVISFRVPKGNFGTPKEYNNRYSCTAFINMPTRFVVVNGVGLQCGVSKKGNVYFTAKVNLPEGWTPDSTPKAEPSTEAVTEEELADVLS